MTTMEKDEIISRLLLKLIAGNITAEEQAQLDAWCAESDDNLKLCQRLQDPAYLEREYRRRKAVETQRPMSDMLRRIGEKSRLRRRKTLGMVAAAACLLLLFGGLGGLFYKAMNNSEPSLAVVEQATDTSAVIRPGGTKAVLTLPNGKKVALDKGDSVGSKALADGSAVKTAKAVSLCLDVPRGGEFKIVLEDGTEVWLNSASRLVYPEHFAAAERRVSVQGEAYFKVKHDSQRPFYVETDGQLLRVYGTEFNIRSYTEDANVLTTLVEGSVALARKGGSGGELVLTPGHQSSFNKAAEDLSVRTVDTDVVTCWRNGKFVFENQDLESIMRDLSRWYDFNYSFAEQSLKQIVFMGSIPRYADFNTALAIIEKSGGITFTVKGRSVNIAKH